MGLKPNMLMASPPLSPPVTRHIWEQEVGSSHAPGIPQKVVYFVGKCLYLASVCRDNAFFGGEGWGIEGAGKGLIGLGTSLETCIALVYGI